MKNSNVWIKGCVTCGKKGKGKWILTVEGWIFFCENCWENFKKRKKLALCPENFQKTNQQNERKSR